MTLLVCPEIHLYRFREYWLRIALLRKLTYYHSAVFELQGIVRYSCQPTGVLTDKPKPQAKFRDFGLIGPKRRLKIPPKGAATPCRIDEG